MVQALPARASTHTQCVLSSEPPCLSLPSAANGLGLPVPPSCCVPASPFRTPPFSSASAPSRPVTRLSCTSGHTSCFGTSGKDNNNSSSIKSTRSNWREPTITSTSSLSSGNSSASSSVVTMRYVASTSRCCEYGERQRWHSIQTDPWTASSKYGCSASVPSSCNSGCMEPSACHENTVSWSGASAGTSFNIRGNCETRTPPAACRRLCANSNKSSARKSAGHAGLPGFCVMCAPAVVVAVTAG